jgi:hypothetical protein
MRAAVDARCQGTAQPLRIAVGIMSRPGNVEQRAAVRRTWGRESPQAALACFVIGEQTKRTPLSPWAPAKKKRAEDRKKSPPRGELSPLPLLPALRAEREASGDVLLLNGSAEIESGGTSGLKTLPWWKHAATHLAGAAWVAKADDDTLINLPLLLDKTLPPFSPRPTALLGSIAWGCYSPRRFKHERSRPNGECGHSEFARSRHEGEPKNLHLTYEGPFAFAYGWFYALPRALVARLASCAYADSFHERALHATSEPYFRKEDDPMNGFWLYKCLQASGEQLQPLPSLRASAAHNMACVSQRGLYRRPHNGSVLVHFLKHPHSLDYVSAVLLRARLGLAVPERAEGCCNRMVWQRGKATAAECKKMLQV